MKRRLKPRLKPETRRSIAQIFARLDYSRLGTIYCDEGGDEFWKDRRGPCQELGIQLVEVFLGRLRSDGRSLYVGAGVAEIPILAMETLELRREVVACTLRADEATLLNRACKALPLQFLSVDARTTTGRFDHLWIVSVLNDPERFPELSALSYGRANSVTFNPPFFVKERERVFAIVESCLNKLRLPGLVTTSVEEISWITDWCTRRRVTCVVEEEDYPTAIVEDPVCFIRIGEIPQK